MSSNETNEPLDETMAEHGHLGGAWEIAIIVVFVFLAAALVGAVVFQVRRRRREKRRRAEEQKLDAERGQRRIGPESKARGKGKLKHPDPVHPHGSEKRGASAYTSRIIDEGNRHEGDVELEETANNSVEFVQPPPPIAQSKRNSKASSYQEYLANNPPKYYWDQR